MDSSTLLSYFRAQVLVLPKHCQGPLLQAQLAWPAVDVTPDTLLDYLQRAAPEVLASESACERVAFADLYGACACLQGDAHAIAQFSDRVGTWVVSATSRLLRDANTVDEVKGRVMEALLFASPPKLAQYDGRSELRRWVAVIAVRTALNMRRQTIREVTLNECLVETLGTDDVELSYFRELYGAEIKIAFALAIEQLSVRQRTMLKNRLIQSLTMEQIGAFYGVHVSTVSRELVDVHRQLKHHTRDHLSRKLGLSFKDFDSVIRLVWSMLERSLPRLVGDG